MFVIHDVRPVFGESSVASAKLQLVQNESQGACDRLGSAEVRNVCVQRKQSMTCVGAPDGWSNQGK